VTNAIDAIDLEVITASEAFLVRVRIALFRTGFSTIVRRSDSSCALVERRVVAKAWCWRSMSGRSRPLLRRRAGSVQRRHCGGDAF
jgi:hypothetical protein